MLPFTRALVKPIGKRLVALIYDIKKRAKKIKRIL